MASLAETLNRMMGAYDPESSPTMYRDDLVAAAVPERSGGGPDIVLHPDVNPWLDGLRAGNWTGETPPQLSYPNAVWDRPTFVPGLGWQSGSNEPISDGASGVRYPSGFASPAERGFISATRAADPKTQRAPGGGLVSEDDFPYPISDQWRSSLAAGPEATPAPVTPRDLAVSPDLLEGWRAPSAAGLANRPNIAMGGPSPAASTYQGRGDWLDTVVIPRESGGRPNIGWGQTDLTPWLQSGQTVYGFPDWPGKPSGTFDKTTGRELPSTAAGLYQITKTNWKHYAPMLGINDFSPESQRKVAEAILRDQGPRAWAASEPGVKSGLRSFLPAGTGVGQSLSALNLGGGGGGEGEADGLSAVAAPSNLSRTLGQLSLSPEQPQQHAAQQIPGAVQRRPVQPLQPVPLPQAPNLLTGYEEALAAILNGQRRGMGSAFG